MAKKIAEETLNILSKVSIANNVAYLTCGTLDRKQYVNINEVLENLGGKWNKKLKGHLFSNDPTEAIDDVILSGEITNPKKEFQQFFTPPELAEKIISLAHINDDHKVLEPSAGHGFILDQINVNCNIHCVEIVPENVKVLKNKNYNVIYENDFLTLAPAPVYDRIVMNPPFKFQSDILHVHHAWKFLKPKGILVSVMSSSITFRDNNKTLEFRNFIEDYGTIIKNPEGAFKSSGTMVNTVIVVLNKP